MDEPDIDLGPTQTGTVDARVRTLSWQDMALAGTKDTVGEWHKRLLKSGLLVEGSKAAADGALQAGDPRREIAAIHRTMDALMASEVRHRELKNDGPWNTGTVRMGTTGILVLLGFVYMTGLAHHGPVGAASLMCAVAAVAMWGDILWRSKQANDEWAVRNGIRDTLRATITRLGTRSWVAPLGREVVENTPHLDLVEGWRRQVRQHLDPWQARLDAMAPLDEIEGLDMGLVDDDAARPDPAAEAEARRQIAGLTTALDKLSALEGTLLETRDAHRTAAARGVLPSLDGLGFDLDEVRGWLRSAGLEPEQGGQSALQWLERGR